MKGVGRAAWSPLPSYSHYGEQMTNKKTPNNHDVLTSSEPSVENSKTPFDGAKTQIPHILSPTSENHSVSVKACDLKTNKTYISPYRISSHSLLWKYSMEGVPSRGKYDEVVMRNWNVPKRVWHYRERVTVISNIKTLEVYVRKRAHRNTSRMLHAAFALQSEVISAFVLEQGIKVTLLASSLPLNAQRGHLVIGNRALNPQLEPLADREGSRLIGLEHPDSSHPRNYELKGPYAVPGAWNLDFLTLKLPSEFAALKNENEAFQKEAAASLALIEAENRTLTGEVVKLTQTIRELTRTRGV